MLRYFHLLLLLAKIDASFAIPNPVLLLGSFWAAQNDTRLLRRANEPGAISTCGYLDGNPTQSRTANPGYNCRFDVTNGLWGFCPTTVIQATDCGLAGACVDQHDCSNGCGDQGGQLTTFTCSPTDFCSTAVFAFATDTKYAYIACGGKAGTVNYLVSPTTAQESNTLEAPIRTTATVTATITAQPVGTPTPSVPAGTATVPVSSAATQSSSLSAIQSQSPDSPASTQSSSLSAVKSQSPDSPATGTSASSAVAPVTSSTGSPQGSTTDNTPAIIGGVIGGIALVCVFGLAAIYLFRRERKASKAQKSGGGGLSQLMVSQSDSMKRPSHRYTGGWGPRELPSEPHDPVELPS